jgi:hypothetical protein
MVAEMEGGLVHVTAPADMDAEVAGPQLKVSMKYVPNEVFYATLAPVALAQDAKITVGREVLPRREQLAAGETGWAYDSKQKILAVGMKADAKGSARLTLAGLRYSAPEAPKPSTAWEFDKDTEGWTGAHACSVKAEGGRLVITVAGQDPYALSGPAAIPADTHKRLAMRVRLTGGNQVGLFWRANHSPSWGPDKQMTIDCPGDGQWREVTFDLSKNPLWSGKVLQLRLDPEPSELPKGSILEVDWIRPEVVK